MKTLIDKLAARQTLSREEFKKILSCNDDYLFECAREAAQKVYGKNIFMRGLIEFTSYCKNNCYYCGLRTVNVVMPNLSPIDVRKKYLLYDNKICTGDEPTAERATVSEGSRSVAAECAACMRNRIKQTGYEIVVSRGDCII